MNIHVNQIVADKVIAVRTSKNVFQDEDIVIKAFGSDYSKADVLKEAWNQACVEETGLPVPECLQVLKFEGQWSIISEYIRGETLEQLMRVHPERADTYLELFVKLQLQVHEQNVPRLVMMQDKLRQKIIRSPLDEVVRSRLCSRLDRMPHEEKLCHGDFIPSNIIMGEGTHPYILDWPHASRGNGPADAANTWLVFCLEGQEDTAHRYLEIYCGMSGTKESTVKDWIPIVAAAGTADCVSAKKRKFLMNQIRIGDC
ncbi:MAG: phosphotransferase [Lachnospiraceae bacterium]